MNADSLAGLLPEEKDRSLVEQFRSAGQGQVFRFLGTLPPDRREALLRQARTIDLAQVTALARSSPDESHAPERVEPLTAIAPDDPDRDRAREAGRAALHAGRVAFLMVAGGQATRLGCDVPKGAYPFAPSTGKSLFRWHAEKVLAASRRYGAAFPWIILVSEANADATEACFSEEGWFGLEGRVQFIRQRMLPAVDEQGRILLESPGRIALAPNGHGGVLEALAQSGALADLGARGIELVSYFQVDNASLNPADTAFLGYHVLREAEMSVKVVRKRDPLEKAGVVCRLDGRPGVLEYSELPDDLAQATDASGRLLLDLANIAAHVFSVTFLDRICGEGLPYHSARKVVSTVDSEGRPTEAAARKFETFVFDAIPAARGFNVFVTERSEEFSPLKNAEGDNSPETVRRDLLERSRTWFRRAGAPAPEADSELEVSPLCGYDFETFAEHLALAHEGEDG